LVAPITLYLDCNITIKILIEQINIQRNPCFPNSRLVDVAIAIGIGRGWAKLNVLFVRLAKIIFKKVW
jgi:hypothetical protein